MDPVLARILNELDRQHRDWQWFYTELGYTKQHVGGWKRRRVPPAEYEMIADVLGKTVDWVARGSEDESTARGATASLSDFAPYTVNLSSDTNMVRAPVVEWARLGTDLYLDNSVVDSTEFESIPSSAPADAKWFRVDKDHPRFLIASNDLLLIAPLTSDASCRDMKLHLFRTVTGEHLLGQFRRLASGYEAIPDSGPSMDSLRHGIVVVGTKQGHIEQ